MHQAFSDGGDDERVADCGAIRLLASPTAACGGTSTTVGEGYRGGSEKILVLLSKVIILIHD
jgi:hypothetical protein